MYESLTDKTHASLVIRSGCMKKGREDVERMVRISFPAFTSRR